MSKSFILYNDLIHTVKKMPKDKMADLFLQILNYVNNEEINDDDLVVNLVFEPIKLQLDRDLSKWQDIRNKRRAAGKIGGVKSGEVRKVEANEASASFVKQNEANEAINTTTTITTNTNITKEDNKYSKVEIKKAENELLTTPKTSTPTSKFNDFQLQVAKKLGEYIKSTKKINLKMGDIKRWANHIRLLQEQDLTPRADSQQDIIKAMQSVLDNSGKEFFPVIESGAAFRNKFTKIESFKEKKTTTSKTTQSMQNVMEASQEIINEHEEKENE